MFRFPLFVQSDLLPFLPFLIVERFSTPRFVNAAIVDDGNVIPFTLFEIEFKPAVIPVRMYLIS